MAGSTHINLGLNHLSPVELAGFLKATAAAMEGSAQFPSPAVPPAELKKAGDDIIAAVDAQKQADDARRVATAHVHDAVHAGHAKATKQAKYVESLADETPDPGARARLVAAAGMTEKAAPVRHKDIAAPTGVSATVGDHVGEADLHWHGRSSKTVRGWNVEGTAEPQNPASFRHLDFTTASKLTVQGLTPGTTMSFRIVAVGGDGKVSEPSALVTVVVP